MEIYMLPNNSHNFLLFRLFQRHYISVLTTNARTSMINHSVTKCIGLFTLHLLYL